MESGTAGDVAGTGARRKEGELKLVARPIGQSTKRSVSFFVDGNPIPKQSYRAVHGGGYTAPHVKAWAKLVRDVAMINMMGKTMFTGLISIELQFFLPDKRRKDFDNLAKNVLDALNGIVYKDDSQIERATIEKAIDKAEPGVYILVEGEG